MAAAAEKGNGVKGERSREEWRCYKPKRCTKGPLCKGGRWVTHSLSNTHTHADTQPPRPAASTSPKGTFHSEVAQHEQGELIINNMRNKEKMRVGAEERHDRKRGGKMQQQQRQPVEKGFLFSSDNVSLFFRGGASREKPLESWNV